MTETEITHAAPRPPWRIGVDVGGTFTDLVMADSTGATWVAKVLSVTEDPSRGVVAALERLASDLGTEIGNVLGNCHLFVHGSTVATNTMLEGKGATVGLLTTEGFRDALELRRGLREDQWNHREPFAPVLVPRYLRLGVGGRMNKNGQELAPLSATNVEGALEVFSAEGVEAVAIALFNSFVNEAHEIDAEEIVRRNWSGKWITRSAAVSPLMGEYERTSTAVINASLAPRIVDYLRNLEERLDTLGLSRPMLLIQSNGGAASLDRIAPRPVNLLLSGPSAAVGALDFFRRAIDGGEERPEDAGNLISMEIGGTSCDVMLMSNGRVADKDDLMIAGYHVSTPVIDIHTIGAGGGTIARVDSAGMMLVGPEGAGADPGPACYGLGGSDATVTDAQLVLGRMRPGVYAGGGIDLNLEAAQQAIRTRVAEPLGLSIEAAAAGIISLLEQSLLHAVEYISIERGHAPARFTLVAAGGAGPMHGSVVARGLGCKRVYVPRDAGALCAVGMLHADLRQDFARFMRGSLDDIEPATVDANLNELMEQAETVMANEGFAGPKVRLRHEIDLHYSGQLWSIRVALDAGPFDPVAVRRAFEDEYQRLYGHVQSDGTIIIASLHVAASATTGRLAAPELAPTGGTPRPDATRPVWHGEDGWLETPVYAGAKLGPGDRLDGPLVVEESTTTVLVGPSDVLSVDATGNFLIDVSAEAARAATPSMEQPERRDPVTLALMQNRLDQISRHMGWVMTRTARSPIFSQSHDFSCFVTDPAGTLIANADGIPIHTGGGGFAVRALLDDFAGRIHPGDVFVLSDPYVAGGNHQPDWVIARPIFVSDAPQLAGFCCNRAHQSDIGGGLAGTYNPEATEIWQEGIRLPVCKLVDRGELRDDLWKLLLINSRTPELLDGDLRAMLGSTRIGEERITAMAEELGLDPYLQHLAGVLDHAEARMREVVAALPDGSYRGEDRTDNDCFRKVDVVIRVALTITGDHLTIDFTGTDGQVAGFKNSSIANTYSSVYLALSSFFDTSIPRNEGTYRCVDIIAPEGSIVNAKSPAPMTLNTVFVAHEIIHAVWQALAEADPSRACAGWSKTVHNHTTGHDDEGLTWVMYQWHAMGSPGATAERDGFPQMGHLSSLGGLDLPNLEYHEQVYPVHYRRWEFRTDAAGPGARRGGSGVCYEADILSPATWSFRAEGLDTPSGYGVQGGAFGAVGEVWVSPEDESADGPRFVPPKYGVRRLGPARMIAHTPGGGGWGDSFARPPELVLRDVRDGVVSRAAAAQDYGVVLTADGRAVDKSATSAERRKRG
jgi:N-methylhydantoinase A